MSEARLKRLRAWSMASLTALTGICLVRAMWIDDYAGMAMLAPTFAITIYLLWDAMRDRQ